jgi:hypothetical protein
VFGTQWALAEVSRPVTERVTKCTVELTLHMAIRELKVYQVKRSRKGLSHFYDDFPRFPLAGMKNYRVLLRNRRITRAPAMSIAMKIEIAPPKAPPN